MYLELADDNCTTCLGDDNLIPIMDDETGKIFMINPELFVTLDPDEQQEILKEAPALMLAIEGQQNPQMAQTGARPGMLGIIQQKIQGFTAKARNIITGDENKAILPWRRDNVAPAMVQQDMQPKFGASLNIEPSPKPWFARPEVLIPGIIGAGAIVYFIFRKK